MATKLIRYTLTGLFAILLLIGLVLLSQYHPDIPVSALTEKYASPPSQFMDLDGLQVHYRDQGLSQDSLPLVLIHGTSSSLHTWEAMTKGLVAHKRVISFDLPAFGLTGPNLTHQYRLSDYVEFVDRFLKRLKIDTCIIAGNSLGGNIAWRYAHAYPQKVARLILLNATGYPQPPADALGFKLGKIPIINNLLTVITPKSLVRKTLEDAYADDSRVSEELSNRYFDLLRRSGNRDALLARLNTPSTAQCHYVPEVQCPTLVIWGELDQVVPVKNAYLFQQDLPNATLHVLPRQGHVPMEESPDLVLPLFRDFIL